MHLLGAQQPRARREDRREARHQPRRACCSRRSPTARSTPATTRASAAPTSSSSSRRADSTSTTQLMELLHHDPGRQAGLGAARHGRHAVLSRTPGRTRRAPPASPSRRGSWPPCSRRRGADRVLSMDLHQGQIQGFFEIPVDHMTAVPMLADYFRYKDFGGTPLVAVSADAGGVKLAKRFINRMPDGDLAVLTKMRPEHNRAETMHFIGDVQRQDRHHRRRHDRHRRHRSSSAIDTLYENGAKEVYVTATHGIFSGPARRAHPRVAGQGGRGHRHARTSSSARKTPRSRCSRWPTSWPTPSRTCSRTSR